MTCSYYAANPACLPARPPARLPACQTLAPPAFPALQAEAAKWMQMAAPTPEKAFVYTLLPLAVNALLDAMTQQAMLPQVEAAIRSDPQLAGWPASQPLPAPLAATALATARSYAVQQWADCSVLVRNVMSPVDASPGLACQLCRMTNPHHLPAL